jgi:gliding motility-associated-like protein
MNCCCGTPKELNFPGFDFEIAPDPPFGWFINYQVGNSIGQSPWNVTAGSIDHVDKDHYMMTSYGNPNGPSNYVDLYGSPPGGGGGPGTIQYPLTGLTPGYNYTIEFYYATFNLPGKYSATIKIANGSWLNETWNATNPGNVIWLKATYNFIAQSSSAKLEFTDSGGTPSYGQIGMLIDDIKLFECPNDLEKPVVNNPPQNIQVECDKDIPDIPKLDVSDNCDLNPSITIKETIDIIDPCTKKITRIWTIKDACGNIQIQNQIIDVMDKTPPQFIKHPENKLFYCDKDITKEFKDWIKKNGNASAMDACGMISWRADYDHFPKKYCDTVIVDFITTDHCGNENSEYATFIVRDTSAPMFVSKAESKYLVCVPESKDSLRAWLSSYGFSKISGECDTVIMSSNFDGDSTKNPLQLTFYAKDRCGNIDSCTATFSYRSSSDTFRITNYSCSFPSNASDTFSYVVNGCDSIVILQKIKYDADTSYIQTNTCNPNQPKFDTLHYTNAFGCDSLIVNEYVLHPTAITRLQKMNCSYLNYSTDTATLSGQFCDSIIITEYIPLQKDSSTVILNTCDISKTDTSILSLINRFGCDSIVTVYTLYSPQQMTFLTKKICGLLQNYTDTVKYTTGLCDSLVITLHTRLSFDTTRIQSSTCDASKAGIFSTTLRNQYGCDSLVIENIQLNPSDSIFLSQTTCILSESGILTKQYKNKFGCDSIVKTTITFIPSDTTQIQQTTCNFAASGTKTLILKGSTCDSVVIVTTDFVPSDTTQIQQTTCDVSAAGNKTMILKGVTCDSVVIISTYFVPSDTIHLSKTSCDPSIAGLDTLILQNSKGCDSIVLTNTAYIPLRLKFGLDSITCFNQHDGIFRILNPGDFGAPYDIILNNNNLGALNQISNLSPGSYELFIRDRNGCVTDSIDFTLSNPPELMIDLGNDLEVKAGSNINLNLQSNKTLQNIFWSPSNLSSCINCSSIQFTVDQDTWVFAQAIDERNCTQSDSIFIRVKKSGSVYAPNSFSPNGDNINDYFYIIGPDYGIIESMYIFDRWGEKIFETQNVPVNNPVAGWNGTLNGQKMNPGVFVYYARVRIDSDTFVNLKGDVTLIR